MISRILVAVDDSAAALAAAAVAVEIAAATGATVQALHVLGDGEVTEAWRCASCTGVPRAVAAEALLAHVARMASAAGVPVHTELGTGDAAPTVLDHARSWPADLVVLGRAACHGTGTPYIGHHTQHVLEFAEVPVLTVPPPQQGTKVPVP